MEKLDLLYEFISRNLKGARSVPNRCRFDNMELSYSEFRPHFAKKHKPEFLEFKQQLAEALGVKALVQKWKLKEIAGMLIPTSEYPANWELEKSFCREIAEDLEKVGEA